MLHSNGVVIIVGNVVSELAVTRCQVVGEARILRALLALPCHWVIIDITEAASNGTSVDCLSRSRRRQDDRRPNNDLITPGLSSLRLYLRHLRCQLSNPLNLIVEIFEAIACEAPKEVFVDNEAKLAPIEGLVHGLCNVSHGKLRNGGCRVKTDVVEDSHFTLHQIKVLQILIINIL
jgi:hypothetical protein